MFQVELKKVRETAGLSQSKLASILNVSQATVGMWESGKREPNFEMLITIANFFNVSCDQLLGREFHPIVPLNEDADIVEPELQENDHQLLSMYHKLSHQGKEYILQQMSIANQLYTKNTSVFSADSNAG